MFKLLTIQGGNMKKIILAFACLALITASPLVAAELQKKSVVKTDQTQTADSKVETKGLTQAPNHVSTSDKVSSTGHKHDGQGSEDLRPNPMDMDAAGSVKEGVPIQVNKPVHQ